MTGRAFDPIGFVEATYRLELRIEEWLAKLAELAEPDFPDHTSVTAYEMRLKLDAGAESAEIGAFAGPIGSFVRDHASRIITTIPAPMIRPLFVFGPRAGSMADLAAWGVLPPEALRVAESSFGDLGRDAFWARALDRESSVSVHVGATFAEPRLTPHAQVKSWQRLAAHLGAGYRLRRALERQGLVELAADPLAGEDGAILTSEGRPLDARGGARTRTALERLRGAVVRRERARTRMRTDTPDEALDLWPALAAGRWSLVDTFESDGRRFVVARVNEEGVGGARGDPRRLTRAEERVARLLVRGLSNKEIAYDLGLSTSRAGTLVASLCRKLGVDRVGAIRLLHMMLL